MFESPPDVRAAATSRSCNGLCSMNWSLSGRVDVLGCLWSTHPVTLISRVNHQLFTQSFLPKDQILSSSYLWLWRCSLTWHNEQLVFTSTQTNPPSMAPMAPSKFWQISWSTCIFPPTWGLVLSWDPGRFWPLFSCPVKGSYQNIFKRWLCLNCYWLINGLITFESFAGFNNFSCSHFRR